MSLITKKMGYLTHQKFWNMKLAKEIKSKNKKINIIYAANTLSHIKNLNSVFKSIEHILTDDGILIIEDPSLMECLKKTAYDQFYNEHIYVFSVISLKNIIHKYKLKIFNIEKLNTHGGSYRFFIKKSSNKDHKINKNVRNFMRQEIKFGINKFKTYLKFEKKR